MKVALSLILFVDFLACPLVAQDPWQEVRVGLGGLGSRLSTFEHIALRQTDTDEGIPSLVHSVHEGATLTSTTAVDANDWRFQLRPISLESVILAEDEGGTPLRDEEATLSETGEVRTDEWRLRFAPYLWAASLTGSGRIKGNRFSGTASFSDIWKNLDLAVQGRVAATKGKWSFFFDGMFMEIGDDTSVSLPGPLPGVSAKGRLQLWLFEWGALYEFANISLADTMERSSLAFEGMVGDRLYRVEGKLRLSPGPSAEDSDTWIDPVIGLRIVWRLPKNFSLVTRGDIGGFGLGSHFSWQVESLLGYDFETKVPIFLAAGYRALGFNFSEGNGSSKFQLDVRFYGPILGFGLVF